jgi:hypothetical protein
LDYIISSQGSLVYLKVGCDAPIALQVRNLLRAWGTTLDDVRAINPVTEKKRLLKHATLLLVDENGKGILVS